MRNIVIALIGLATTFCLSVFPMIQADGEVPIAVRFSCANLLNQPEIIVKERLKKTEDFTLSEVEVKGENAYQLEFRPISNSASRVLIFRNTEHYATSGEKAARFSNDEWRLPTLQEAFAILSTSTSTPSLYFGPIVEDCFGVMGEKIGIWAIHRTGSKHAIVCFVASNRVAMSKVKLQEDIPLLLHLDYLVRNDQTLTRTDVVAMEFHYATTEEKLRWRSQDDQNQAAMKLLLGSSYDVVDWKRVNELLKEQRKNRHKVKLPAMRLILVYNP